MGTKIGSLLAAASLLGVPAIAQAQEAAINQPATAELQAAMAKTAKLRKAVTVEGILKHERVLAAFARRHDNNRASGTRGYDLSSWYVRAKLQRAGYSVRMQNFTFDLFEETAPAELARVAPLPATFALGDDFLTMEYSGSGTVSGPLVPTEDIQYPPADVPGSTSGCEPDDLPAAPGPGAVALIQRGTCDFLTKATNAAARGYAAAIIFNEGQEGRQDVLNGTLGESVPIPVVGTSFDLGEQLYLGLQEGPVTVEVSVTSTVTTTQTRNVLADSPRGRADRVVVVGAHLDSVPEGPGINDNGSGVSMILDMAEQIQRLHLPLRNKLRFAFWGAEESGLIGSTYYVANLSEAELATIDSNLNFDMVGSPNFVRFVYDGDGSAGLSEPGPTGSAAIERQFLWFFQSQGLQSEPTAFDGRSDYGPFIEAGIPAGGLFTGAEGIKTEREAAIYGGTAGAPYDACYHEACDGYANLNRTALDQMSDAAAYTALTLAGRDQPLRGAGAMARLEGAAVGGAMAYRGPRLQR